MLSAYRLSSPSSDARRIWFWRYSPVIFTGFVCFFAGGIVSEVVQSMLPVRPPPLIYDLSRLILTPQYKEFQIWDVVANLLGSSVGLYISYHLEKYYRHRREVRDRSLDLTRSVILMGFRSHGCTDLSTRITYLTAKMKMTSKQVESNYKLPHNSSQNPLRPTKFLRWGPSAWVTCGMNGKNCLAWAETVMRIDRTEICTY